MNLDAAMSYVGFVEARHEAFIRRQEGWLPEDWYTDRIVATRKFTNVFRVLDYGSQYVLTDLVDPELDPVDQLLRLFLYRHTGRVEVWEYLEMTSGLPTRGNLQDVLAAMKEYRGENRPSSGNPWTDPKNEDRRRNINVFKRSIFTNAYLVYPQSDAPGTDKLESIISLTHRLAENGSFDDFVHVAQTQQDRFDCLRRNKGVADFMSMQILTDWGYTPHCGQDRENDFVVAGPGARKGAAALGWAERDASAAIQWAWESIQHLSLPGTGRHPSWMDAQNTLCEFSKYVRYELKPIPDKPYTPAHPGPQKIVLPEHW